MTIEQYSSLVKRMRSKQKDYFRTRDRTVLNECRDLERRVDEATEAILNPQPPALFEDGK